MKAFKEIGFRKTLKYILWVPCQAIFRILGYSPLRVAFLRICGAHIGPDTIIHGIHFFNGYRKGIRGLTFTEQVFIGDECLLDLADDIILERQVTLAERVTILTHMNVGYADHPLQKQFPSNHAPVTIKQGSFVGANCTILAGVTIGPQAFVAAGSVVTKDVPPRTLVGGVPAAPIRTLA